MSRTRPAAVVSRLGRQGLWLTLGLLFLGIGLQKLTAYEAAAVRPLAEPSPLLGWCYRLWGARGASVVFAMIEVPIGLGLLWGLRDARSWAARLAAGGAAITALVTSSFLFTAPGVLVRAGGAPLLSLDVGQLFAKDLVLLAGALVLLGESLGGRR